MDFFGYVQALVLFLAVLGLAALTTRAAARKMRVQGHLLQILESIPVGSGKQIILIRAGKKIILAGLGDKAIAHLATFDPSDFGAESTDDLSRLDAEELPHTGAFGEILKRISRR